MASNPPEQGKLFPDAPPMLAPAVQLRRARTAIAKLPPVITVETVEPTEVLVPAPVASEIDVSLRRQPSVEYSALRAGGEVSFGNWHPQTGFSFVRLGGHIRRVTKRQGPWVWIGIVAFVGLFTQDLWVPPIRALLDSLRPPPVVTPAPVTPPTTPVPVAPAAPAMELEDNPSSIAVRKRRVSPKKEPGFFDGLFGKS